MQARKFPTFGQLRRYLEDLGFEHRDWEYMGIPRHIYLHPETGCEFRFRDRPNGDMVRGDEVLNVHHHLWWRGLIPDEMDIYQFLANFVAADKAGKAG